MIKTIRHQTYHKVVHTVVNTLFANSLQPAPVAVKKCSLSHAQQNTTQREGKQGYWVKL